jgi:hypothetical protein
MKTKDPDSNKHPAKKYPTIAVCGLDCGLCPRFYTAGPSRCPGCAGPGFHEKHPSCSFITCCVKNKGHEVCSECAGFPCGKIKSAEEYAQAKESSSYPSYRKILPNLYFIKEHGIRKFIEHQRKRIQLLETMIAQFDEGRSKSFFCRAANLHELTELTDSLQRAAEIIENDKVKQSDMKSKAKILKAIINAIPAAE